MKSRLSQAVHPKKVWDIKNVGRARASFLEHAKKPASYCIHALCMCVAHGEVQVKEVRERA